jgi:hypothetical protein
MSHKTCKRRSNESQQMKSMKSLYLCTVALAILCGMALTIGAAPTPSRVMAPTNDLPYSFERSPYINPKVVQDLTTSLSDHGDHVVAINLLDSQKSNRYHGDVKVRKIKGKQPFVYFQENGTQFGYQHVGTTTSGIHVLLTSESGDGSGTFESLLLLTIEDDKGLSINLDEKSTRQDRPRLLLMKLGSTCLGDRWSGDLKVKGNELFIGKDKGWFTISGGTGGGPLSTNPKDRVLQIDANSQIHRSK